MTISNKIGTAIIGASLLPSIYFGGVRPALERNKFNHTYLQALGQYGDTDNDELISREEEIVFDQRFARDCKLFWTGIPLNEVWGVNMPIFNDEFGREAVYPERFERVPLEILTRIMEDYNPTRKRLE